MVFIIQNSHFIAIDILSNIISSRREREEKSRVDYIGLAIDIVNDLRERHQLYHIEKGLEIYENSSTMHNYIDLNRQSFCENLEM